MSQPLLSIGMIVKNEERCLEKCLKALEPLRQAISCELVIADTGSTDKTVEIANKYADKLFFFEWVNDFSKARNAVLDQCSGKWHLYIDADEYLSVGIPQLSDFLTSSSEKTKSFASIIIRNHTIPQMNGPYADFNSLRLFRIFPNNRFIGAIHEYIPYTKPEDCHILNEVIFDHDGYTQISPKHLKEKEKRNLAILEQELSKNPENIRTIVQCLEASTHNDEKRRYYTDYASSFIKKANHKNDSYDALVPLCAFRVIANLAQDYNPAVNDFFKWSLENFGYSHYILVDAIFIYTRYLFQKADYNNAIHYGTEYFKNLGEYEASKSTVSNVSFLNPVIFCNPYSQNEIRTILASSLLKNEKNSEALSFLADIQLNVCDDNTLKLWTEMLFSTNDAQIHDKCKEAIYEVFEQHNTDTSYTQAYNSLKECFFSHFSCANDSISPFFKNFNSDIGISYDIINTKGKKEVEKLLGKIKNWEDFMPQALKQSMMLKVDFPEEFFFITPSHLTLILSDLCIDYNNLTTSMLEKYCTKDYCSNFPRSSFAFNLLSTILFNNTIPKDTKKPLINAFSDVSECFLKFCYNSELFRNEAFIVCLPATHTLAWYLVKANKLKPENPLEYIKTLRTALQKVPQAKEIIEFLIEDLQAEEEKKKQEQIKNAAPELVAMAEQLKVMLSAFPENSPELLAIKQSPMYKQVAFLIED